MRLEVSLGGQNREVVMASPYMLYDSAQPPSSVDIAGLIEDCKAKRRELIIGSDANSHHTVWGSFGINRRGEALLEYLAGTELEITNRGNGPTFHISKTAEAMRGGGHIKAISESTKTA